MCLLIFRFWILVSGFPFPVFPFGFRVGPEANLSIPDSGFWFLVSAFGFQVGPEANLPIPVSGFEFLVSASGLNLLIVNLQPNL